MTVQTLIAKYNYNEITCEQLADLAGFTQKERKLMYMFWDAAYNNNKIYLSDELVLTYLTNSTGRDAVTDYIRRVFKKNCIEGKDYIQIDKNHELVVNYYKSFGPDNCPDQKNIKKITMKCYYAITGRCSKKLFMMAPGEKGEEVREYYIKLEDLVILMKDYISDAENL